MENAIKRIYVEKKEGLRNTADALLKELNGQLNESISSLRCFIRYDIEGIDEEDFQTAVNTVFSDPFTDDVYYESLPELNGYVGFNVEYLPGQYDMRADSAAQCVQLLTLKERPIIRCATVYAVSGVESLDKIINYTVNPVDSRLAENSKPLSLKENAAPVSDVKVIYGFRIINKKKLEALHKKYALAMTFEDLRFLQGYFTSEGRDPTETEIRVLDTYWSDHCRHTTFLTELDSIALYSHIPEIKEAYKEYHRMFLRHTRNRIGKYKCLMDMATMVVRELKCLGQLKNLDVSDEINACSIKVKAETSEGDLDYLVMFKNETHNHPTEIEPFGGAATCLGGAIRDPLSGRAYVYHAMRLTGAADITAEVGDTLEGKLPQRLISKEAARGFSSYGNQIGLATGIVAEIYHHGYDAKRLETGFVVAAAPAENVVREKVEVGDFILLIGGETGRDGCGGATGSSKVHNKQSVNTCGAEVQKGNPVTERKIQRLFRNPECTKLIKKCNDFGAGGVCVAVGELADSVLINLDAIPKKYDSLSGTELAVSESQERMAVVISPKNVEKLVKLCISENISAAAIAIVTNNGSMIMMHNNKEIVNLKREILSSNGVRQTASAVITDRIPEYMNVSAPLSASFLSSGDYASALSSELQRLNVGCNKGMSEMFDSTIGAGTLFMPFGGKKQLCPAIATAALLPVPPHLETDTASVISWGFDPYLMGNCPFVGAQYSVILSVAKLCATGVDYDGIYLTFQEYFKKLGNDPFRWGEPVSAMLGAVFAQIKLGIAAIGGKDSMSGTFEDKDVPPTLISFSLAVSKASKLITNVLYEGAKVYRIELKRSPTSCPDYDFFRKLMKQLHVLINEGKINFCTVVEAGGAVSAVTKSCLGNGLGFNFDYYGEDLFYPRLGDILFAGEVEGLAEFSPKFIGEALGDAFVFGESRLSVEDAEAAYLKTIATVFPISGENCNSEKFEFYELTYSPYIGEKFAAPTVLIPVFPGTNCEYDTSKKFLRAGAKTETFVFRNINTNDIAESAEKLAELIKTSQIIAIPGGFSAGDEPDGSAKFIATVFRSPEVSDAVKELLEIRQGLILGICNGFQALIKLGLLPYNARLYHNNIGRHISALCRVRVSSTDSPWLSNVRVGDEFMTAISHGEGRLISDQNTIEQLKATGRVCTQYVGGNPNGSAADIEGLISPCGRILGKMGHVERSYGGLYKNVADADRDIDVFSAGVRYFA